MRLRARARARWEGCSFWSTASGSEGRRGFGMCARYQMSAAAARAPLRPPVCRLLLLLPRVTRCQRLPAPPLTARRRRRGRRGKCCSRSCLRSRTEVTVEDGTRRKRTAAGACERAPCMYGVAVITCRSLASCTLATAWRTGCSAVAPYQRLPSLSLPLSNAQRLCCMLRNAAVAASGRETGVGKKTEERRRN